MAEPFDAGKAPFNRLNAPPGAQVDLSFAPILADLGLPALDRHDAFYGALMTAMMYVALADLKARNIRIPRQFARPITHFGGGSRVAVASQNNRAESAAVEKTKTRTGQKI